MTAVGRATRALRATPDDVADEFFDALRRADEAHALDLALGLVGDGVPVTDVLLRLVCPAQERVGLLWQTAEWSVAMEHAATCINERVVAALGSRTTAGGQRGHVVLGCLDGEWHALPARVVAEVLRQAGWRVTFLGASVPPGHLISYLHEQGPDVVALSCALPVHLPTAHQTITAAQRTGTPVLAGGPGFGTDGRWARRLGVDAWAASATDAVDLLEQRAWESAEPDRAGPEIGGAEYAGLRDRRPALITAAVDRLRGFSPLAGESANGLDGEVSDDVGRIVDFLAAAVYLADRDLFVDYLTWMGGVLESRSVPPVGVVAVLDVLAARLHDFPFAQDCLVGGRAAVTGEKRIP